MKRFLEILGDLIGVLSIFAAVYIFFLIAYAFGV